MNLRETKSVDYLKMDRGEIDEASSLEKDSVGPRGHGGADADTGLSSNCDGDQDELGGAMGGLPPTYFHSTRHSKPQKNLELDMDEHPDILESNIISMEEEMRRLDLVEKELMMKVSLQQKHLSIQKLNAELAHPLSQAHDQRHIPPGPGAGQIPAVLQQQSVSAHMSNLVSDQSNFGSYGPPPPQAPIAMQQQTAGRVDLNPQVYLNRPPNQGKHYRCIIDFIPRSARQSDEEFEIATGVVLKVNPTIKPKLETVTPAQWVAANACILGDMIRNGGVSMETVLDYMSYTAKVGELATKYTWVSVILYDDQYRLKQHEFQYRWGSDSPHLISLNLDVRTKNQRPGNSFNRKPDASRDQHGDGVKAVCRNYNAGVRCPFNPCRFKHACEVCGKGHARIDHDKEKSDASTPPAKDTHA
jgi:hypothetical protein